MQIRLIVNLCEPDQPDIVLQLQARQVAVIAQALGTLRLGNGHADHVNLATAFQSIQRMLQVGVVADEP
jgi:hypothetical protein